MKRFVKIMALMLTFIIAASISSCKKEEGSRQENTPSKGTQEPQEPVGELRMLSLSSITLDSTFSRENDIVLQSAQEVTWESADEAIVTVDESGEVIAVGEGSTVIKATTKDGSRTEECKVTVKKLTEMNDSELADYCYTKAMLSYGNADRIARAMNKADNGEEITVAVIGGSITAGANASDFGKTSYGPLMSEWWKAKFPNTKVNFVNAGAGGTDSLYGVTRANEELLKSNPDFVIVEFSVNDKEFGEYNKKYLSEVYEGLLRKIMNSQNKPGVIIFENTYNTGTNAEKTHVPVAEHYNVPILSYKSAIWPVIRYSNAFGKVNEAWKVFYGDDIHPNDKGHKLISEIIIRYLDSVYDQRKAYSAPNDTLTDIMNETNRFEDADFLTAGNMKDLELGDWVNSGRFFNTSTPGASMKFKNTAGVIALDYVKGQKAKGEVYIDGEKVADINASKDGNWTAGTGVQFVLDEKDAKEREIEIKLTSGSFKFEFFAAKFN